MRASKVIAASLVGALFTIGLCMIITIVVEATGAAPFVGSLLPCTDPDALRVISLLERDPSNWSGSEYVIEHAPSVTVWIANRDYGIGLSTDPADEARPSSGPTLSWACRAQIFTSALPIITRIHGVDREKFEKGLPK